jgi:hypothetical protein
MMGACFRDHVGSFVVGFEGAEKHKRRGVELCFSNKTFFSNSKSFAAD